MGSWPVSVAAGRKLVQGPPFSGAQSAPASTDLKPPPLDLRCNDDAHHASWTLKEWRTDPRMSPHFPPIGPIQPVGKGVPALDRRPPVPAVPRRGTSRVDAPACRRLGKLLQRLGHRGRAVGTTGSLSRSRTFHRRQALERRGILDREHLPELGHVKLS